jgi:HAAS
VKVQESIAAYLADISAQLEVTDAERRRIVEEIEGHLQDAVAQHEARGMDRSTAIDCALAEFGPASEVAVEFSSTAEPTSALSRAIRWRPLWIPGALAALHLGSALYALSWIPNMTPGQRAFFANVFVNLVIHCALAFTAWRSEQSSRRSRSLVWIPTAIAVLLFVGSAATRSS